MFINFPLITKSKDIIFYNSKKMIIEKFIKIQAKIN